MSGLNVAPGGRAVETSGVAGRSAAGAGLAGAGAVRRGVAEIRLGPLSRAEGNPFFNEQPRESSHQPPVRPDKER